ncbi:MAG: DEAD/DEAH box helicase [Sulfuriferula sp.]
MTLSEQDLRDHFSETWLARGRDLVWQERVLDMECSGDKRYMSARVQGSRTLPYPVTIRVNHSPKGWYPVGHCGCPVGYNCKHVAAVLIAALGDGTQSVDGVPAGLDIWLQRLGQAAQAAGPDGQFAPEVQDRLLYVIEALADGRLVVRLLKARLLQKGGYGSAKPWTGFKSLYNPNPPQFVSPVDWDAVELLRTLERGLDAEPSFYLSGHRGAIALRQLLLTGRAFWQSAETEPLRYQGARPATAVWVDATDGDQRLTLQPQPPARVLALAPPWWLDVAAHECGELDTGLTDAVAETIASSPAVPMQVMEAVTRRLAQIPATLPVPARLHTRNIDSVIPTTILRLTSQQMDGPPLVHYGWQRPGQTVHVDLARLEFDYQGSRVNIHTEGDSVNRRIGDELLAIQRHHVTERAALQQLEALDFFPAKRLDLPGASKLGDAFTLEDEDGWADFAMQHLPGLVESGWRVETTAEFRWDIAEAEDEWHAELDETSGTDWFGLELGITVAGERISLLPILAGLVRDLSDDAHAALLRGEAPATGHYLAALPSGKKIALPAERVRGLLAVLVELFDGDALDSSGRLEMNAVHAARLADIDSAARLRWLSGDKLLELGRKLREFSGVIPVAPPAGLQAELRPYQQEGLNWLQFLREYNLGGVLGDDMGLGKTLQALAHILIEKEAGRADRPSLVVAPTSLMFNWRREANRFAPDLRVLVLHGPDRATHFDNINDYDLVLTTYALLPRDSGALAECQFHLLILDEAHFIKNPKSQATQVVHKLAARHRLALTGTPMENNLGELWSLFHFLVPGLLGNEAQFKRVFRNPIEKYHDTLCRDALARRISPFLLRRTKAEVAQDLPAKTDIPRTCELSGAQRDLYETIRATMQDKVRNAIAEQGFKKSQIVILDALLKLRQVCCDPRLLALPAARKVKESAKLELLMALLPEMLAEGRRILLFSQFTSMLSLIEQELDEREIDFVKLTGQTRDRETPVNRFQAGEVPLFLISLKAGGTGLNLTAADTVIHYDPWWNPAVEDQATGRAHRIGQLNPVFVYKLYTEGTVEEKILALQERKRSMVAGVLGDNEHAANTLTAEDLRVMFEPLD